MIIFYEYSEYHIKNNKSLIIWRRLGKEHSENAGYQKNNEEIVKHHLDEKLNRFRKTEETKGHWWQLKDLAKGYELDLVTSEEMIGILTAPQELVDTIRNGKFPPADIEVIKETHFDNFVP